MLEPHQRRDDRHDLGHRARKLQEKEPSQDPSERGWGGAHDILAVIIPTIENQSDRQKEGVQSTTLDRVPNHSLIERIELGVRDELAGVLSLLYPPYYKASDDQVGRERDREQGRSDGFDFEGEGGLTRDEIGEFPDRHGDQRFFFVSFWSEYLI